MPALTVRRGLTPAMLRKLAKAEEDVRVARRLLAIANALDGMDRKAAAEAAGNKGVGSGRTLAAFECLNLTHF